MGAKNEFIEPVHTDSDLEGDGVLKMGSTPHTLTDAAGLIEGAKIKPGTVDTAQIATNAITNNEINNAIDLVVNTLNALGELIENTGAGDLVLRTNGNANQLVLDSDGGVAIGHVAPSAGTALDVRGGGANFIRSGMTAGQNALNVEPGTATGTESIDGVRVVTTTSGVLNFLAQNLSGGKVVFLASVSAGGSAYSRYQDSPSGVRWSAGILGSDSNAYVIGNEFTFGNSKAIRIDASSAAVALLGALSVDNGNISAGEPATARGVTVVYSGAANAPGTRTYASPDGNLWYLFVDDLGRLRRKLETGAFQANLPASNSDGIVIGGTPVFKSYTMSAGQLVSGIHHTAGFYNAASTDANLDEGTVSIQFGLTNISYAAHAFIVAQFSGSDDAGGIVALVVSGTSIDDEGTRIPGSSETLVPDITQLGSSEYVETTKKWIGIIQYELISSGSVVFNVDFNYGFAKYDDVGNRDVQLTDFEATGLANKNDTGFDIRLIHHKATGWTYDATDFVAGPGALLSMNTDHVNEKTISSGNHFAYKRAGLSVDVNGNNGEGFIIEVETSAIETLSWANFHIGMLYT